MSKRPDTLQTVLVALELMRRIPRIGKITAQELHSQLAETEVARTERTIQRQLEMLAGYFKEIEYDNRSKPYGYQWSKKSSGMALSKLTEQESLIFMLAEQHLKSLLPANLMKSMEGFFSQAHKILAPHTNAKREREWLSKVRVVSTTQPLLPPKIDVHVFEQVSNALYANLWLAVKYENAEGKITEADVMPLGLAQQGTRLYLVCRFRDYNNERCLALNRFQSAQASTINFVRPKDFSLEQFDDDGRFGYGKGKRIKLTMVIEKKAGKHLLESRLSEDQTVKELDDTYQITATVVETAQLDWWLRGFGDTLHSVSKRKVV